MRLVGIECFATDSLFIAPRGSNVSAGLRDVVLRRFVDIVIVDARWSISRSGLEMTGDDYRAAPAMQERLRAARRRFSEDEYGQVQRALEQLNCYELSTLQDISPSAAGDNSWAPITDFVGDDDSPDDMTAVSAAATHLEDLGLIESQSPAAGDEARIDLMRYRIADLGHRFANAVRRH